MNQLRQCINVGRFQFGDLAVLDHLARQRVLAGHLFQDVRRG